MKYCCDCNAPVDVEIQKVCPKCGKVLKEERDGIIYENTVDYELPMRWFKFLIYFSLFADAVINLVLAVIYFHDAFVLPDIVLVIKDVMYGLVCSAFCIFCIYTRFRLAGFKKNAPLCIVILYALSFAIRLMLLIVSALYSPGMDLFLDITILISEAILLCGNYIYFKRRKYKFIN